MLVAFDALFCLLVIGPLISCLGGIGRARVSWVHFGVAMVTAGALVCGAGVALAAWCRGLPFTLDLSHFSPFTFLLSIDRLSGFFLFLVCAVSLPAVAYSLPYIGRHYGKTRAAWYWALLPLFLLSMII